MGAPLTPAKFIKGVYQRGYKRGGEVVCERKGRLQNPLELNL